MAGEAGKARKVREGEGEGRRRLTSSSSASWESRVASCGILASAARSSSTCAARRSDSVGGAPGCQLFEGIRSSREGVGPSCVLRLLTCSGIVLAVCECSLNWVKDVEM